MPRIYTLQCCALEQDLCLEAQASHYLTRVLRCSINADVELFNGDGHTYHARITQIDKREVWLHIDRLSTPSTRSPLHIHLGIGISKGERMDTIMQKCTELGVQSITPLSSEHLAFKLKPEQLKKKLTHWQQIVISACEQSQQNHLPALHSVSTLHTWLENNNADLKLCLDPRADKKLSHFATQKITSLLLLVGPEGGLSAHEISSAEQHHFNTIQLGSRILRTETAPLAITAIAQYLWGDF